MHICSGVWLRRRGKTLRSRHSFHRHRGGYAMSRGIFYTFSPIGTSKYYIFSGDRHQGAPGFSEGRTNTPLFTSWSVCSSNILLPTTAILKPCQLALSCHRLRRGHHNSQYQKQRHNGCHGLRGRWRPWCIRSRRIRRVPRVLRLWSS